MVRLLDTTNLTVCPHFLHHHHHSVLTKSIPSTSLYLAYHFYQPPPQPFTLHTKHTPPPSPPLLPIHHAQHWQLSTYPVGTRSVEHEDTVLHAGKLVVGISQLLVLPLL